MKIVWARQKKKEKKKPAIVEDAEKKDAKESTEKLVNKSPEELQVFTVTPAEITLNAKMGIMVEIRANSPQTGKLKEQWEC